MTVRPEVFSEFRKDASNRTCIAMSIEHHDEVPSRKFSFPLGSDKNGIEPVKGERN